MVERYHVNGGLGLEINEQGKWVLYKYYEKLDNKNKKLEKENEQLKEALKHALNFVNVKYESIESFMEHWRKEYNLVHDDPT